MCLNYNVTEIIIHVNMSLQLPIVTLLEGLGHVVHDDNMVGKVTYLLVKKCIFVFL